MVLKREHIKIIHPLPIRKTSPVTYANGHVEVFNIDHSIERELPWRTINNWWHIVRRLIRRWETRDTPDPSVVRK